MDKKKNNDTLTKSHPPLPKRAAQFHFISNMITRFIPLKIRNFFSKTFFYLSGEIPFSITEFFKHGRIRSAFWSAFILTFLFAFVGQVITTNLQNSFSGEDVGKIYFSDDWKNILNYVFICPMYVGLSTIFFLTLINIRSGAHDLARMLGDQNKDFSNGKMPAFVIMFLVLSMPAIGIVNYIAEVLNPSIYSKEFWFVLKTAPSGDRILGMADIYYALVNYVLQLITVLAAFSFAYLVYYAGKVGEIVDSKDVKDEIVFTKLKNHLTQFVYGYLIAKALVATYMINILYTWPVSNPTESTNFVAAGILILLIGLFIVPFPRYYIQMRWYEFAKQRAEAGFGDYPSYQDLRTENIQGVSWFLDSLIIFNAAKEIWFAIS